MNNLLRPLQQFWHWLTTPDPTPGYGPGKLLRLALRVVLFALLATLVSAWLQLTPLRPYLETWWGSLLLVMALYVPLARFMTLDTITPSQMRQPGQNAVPLSEVRFRRAGQQETGKGGIGKGGKQANRSTAASRKATAERVAAERAAAERSAQRRREKKRYAGVSKPPPKLGGKR